MSTAPAASRLDVREFEQFLFHEASLLDERRWQEWNELFVPDGEYWVPASVGQPNATDHLSLIYETGLLRSIRIARFTDPNAFSLQPMPRSVHLICNVVLDAGGETDDTYTVRSSFLMAQYRGDIQTLFCGKYAHRLRRQGRHLKIVSKRVDLINCDAALESILLYL